VLDFNSHKAFNFHRPFSFYGVSKVFFFLIFFLFWFNRYIRRFDSIMELIYLFLRSFMFDKVTIRCWIWPKDHHGKVILGSVLVLVWFALISFKAVAMYFWCFRIS
jgi:hypothetical protein